MCVDRRSVPQHGMMYASAEPVSDSFDQAECIMETTITAVYENGVFRPLTPLALPEHAEVEISIRTQTPDVDDAEAHRRRVHNVLTAAGLRLPTAAGADMLEGLLSEEERQRLAQRLP